VRARSSGVQEEGVQEEKRRKKVTTDN